MTSNLLLDTTLFDIVYKVNNTFTSGLRVVDEKLTHPDSFNTSAAPFLFPSNVQSLGIDLNVYWTDSNNTECFWDCEIQMFVAGSTSPITSSTGISHTRSEVNAALPAGTSQRASFTPIIAGGDAEFQPGDFPLTTPVKMQIIVIPFMNSARTEEFRLQTLDNICNFWLMRV